MHHEQPTFPWQTGFLAHRALSGNTASATLLPEDPVSCFHPCSWWKDCPFRHCTAPASSSTHHDSSFLTYRTLLLAYLLAKETIYSGEEGEEGIVKHFFLHSDHGLTSRGTVGTCSCCGVSCALSAISTGLF